jgi:hypothetical protein
MKRDWVKAFNQDFLTYPYAFTERGNDLVLTLDGKAVIFPKMRMEHAISATDWLRNKHRGRQHP